MRRDAISPGVLQKSAGQFDPGRGSINFMSVYASKELEFPVMALVGSVRMPAEGGDKCE